MFYYLKGSLALKTDTFLVLDINGVGFKVFSSRYSMQNIALNDVVQLYTYVHIREDALDVFGFLTKEELDFFQKLISISGVGPKVALAMLSTLTPADITKAVITGDVKKITATPGVGTKLAQRVILELKNILKDIDVENAVYSIPAQGQPISEALEALCALGYKAEEANRALASVGNDLSLEETIKKALVYLAR